jgi:hypothetical protein
MINYILSIILSLTILVIIEIFTPIGSLIFEFKEYTTTAWSFQILFISIAIAIGIEIGTWINNR